MRVKEESGGRGTIHVTWGKCPNRTCQSRDWKKWDVDFDEEEFWCGTCELPIEKPTFVKRLKAQVRKESEK